ncbi:MAG: bifunctional folylpolyglutamate synthase/dihydrofolate synthase [Saccharofermentans sp.]|nr:bifunctional folylpolyglutamate synthase/dihydrofolate synthase [Saccharofermentans sp.]
MTQKTPEYLSSALKFGINPGLSRINRLCELLGHPEKDFKVVHIAGTNGKGSVTSFMSSMLAASGLKVGVFTSPYLERFSERIRIIDCADGLRKLHDDDSYGEIDDDDLKRLTEQVKVFSEQVFEEQNDHPTEFELITAICFMYFAEKGIDVAVLETGLGGRLDSTNVECDKAVSVITAIGMDHTEVLGDTIDKIAREKAGIMRRDCPCFCTDPDSMIISPDYRSLVREAILDEADKHGCPLTFVGTGEEEPVYTKEYRMTVKLLELGGREVSTELLGKHQAANLALAAAAVRCLKEIWPSVTEETMAEGIELTRWKCRAEVVSAKPFVILDGGHNRQGAESFAGVYGALDNGELIKRPARLVIGVMKDKDIEGIAGAYKEGGIDIAEVWPVRVNNPRTAEPGELYKIINKVYNKPIGRGTSEQPEEAVKIALSKSEEDDMPLIITGSLYLLGQVRGTVKRLI